MEGGGLLCKKSGPNRYVWISAAGLGSGGSNLKDPRSNRSRRLRIGRRRGFGRAGGGGTLPATNPAAGDRRRVAILGFPGSARPGIWSWMLSAACVTHSCAQSSGLGFRTACVAAVADVHGGASPANGVLGVLGLRIHKN